MKLRIARLVVPILSLVLFLIPLTVAQTPAQTTSALPRLVRFASTAKDLNGNPLTGVIGITFAFYSEQTGGAPLWLETQNVTADSQGHYTALLGSTKPDGLPADLFTSEQARWVGVQVSGQAEQPRVLLVSAPYALKAGDAETLGGLPPSAFVLATPAISGSTPASSTTETVSSLAAADVTTTGGTLNYLPIFSGADTIVDSAMFQTGSGTTAKIGIDTVTPATQLDVNGAGTIRGTLTLPATGTATATAGDVSQGLNFVASSYDSTSATGVNQTFRWHAEPAANDTTAPSGTLNLLYGLGTAAPSETGLKISSKGIFTFATGQTFSSNSAAIGVVGTTTGTLSTNSGVEGIASTASGSATGVYGSSASPSGYGVEGASGNVGVFGTGGTISSVTGIGVEGSGNQYGVYGNVVIGTAANQAGVLGTTSITSATTYGVEGLATATSGTEAGVFGNSSSTAGYGVLGTSPNVGLFGSGTGSGGIGVDGHGNAIGVKGVASASGGLSGYFGGGPVEVAGNGNNAFFGDPGCGSGFSGFGLTTNSLSGCSNYTLIGKSSGDIYLNSTGSASIHFRNGNSGGDSNGDLATIDHSGNLTVSGKVHSGNVAAAATASNFTVASTNDCLIPLTAPNSNCLTPGMSVTITTSGGPVLILANIGGAWVDGCVGANFYLAMDKQFISTSFAFPPQTGEGFVFSPVQMQSLQVPAAGTHTFQVQESDDAADCGSGGYSQTYVSGTDSNAGWPNATRSLIVREF